jgi:phage terminase large subunit GpA-like protein
LDDEPVGRKVPAAVAGHEAGVDDGHDQGRVRVVGAGQGTRRIQIVDGAAVAVFLDPVLCEFPTGLQKIPLWENFGRSCNGRC